MSYRPCCCTLPVAADVVGVTRRTLNGWDSSPEGRLRQRQRGCGTSRPIRLSVPGHTYYDSHDWQGTVTGAMGQRSNLLFTIPY